MPRPEKLSLSHARRTLLRAHGLDAPRPSRTGPVTLRQVEQLGTRLGVVQIDSVNVLARAHLVPAFSRLGPYDVGLLDRATGSAPRRLVESWAHQASFVPVESYPLLEWRRQAYQREAWGGIAAVATTHGNIVDDVRAIVAERGPVTASEVQVEFEAEHPTRKVEWGWNWSIAKRVLEFLFFTGEVASAGRNPAFERRYDLTERVLPAHVLAATPPDEPDAVRELVAIAARAHGIGSTRSLADHFRLRMAPTQRAIDELVEDGVLTPVQVDGWGRAYRHRTATTPRRATGAALLNPFDPLVFERRTVEALFGLRYRIEVYVPEPRRVWGYYVLPFLLGEELAALVDLKADRAAGVLEVRAAHGTLGTAGAGPAAVAAALAAELELAARWLGLDSVRVGSATRPAAGDLAAEVRAATAAVAA
ncbi:winged helix-turn-helix domain-containing protein [Cellulomonas alba]|uniref:Crosslink repair DNA glycosylase YcaQ family protein n=1 Tax=Cellulomonas alba TaxID=3053467 RepID=A0ABT7SCT2_9CELL|nr:crosslink repair DNA glycosylase YcaQ family protein [Cellulomonas alba]MDM7853985.1 crosslink repair DNA glycosylase YcaQ family protein [Cellulomonas alba]